MTIVVLLLIVLLLLLLGGWAIGVTLALFGYVLTGLIVGGLARLIVPNTTGLDPRDDSLRDRREPARRHPRRLGRPRRLLSRALGRRAAALLIAIFSAGSARRAPAG